MYTLEKQIDAARLEISLRKTFVGSMAKEGVEVMESILETLEAMQRLRKIWKESEYMRLPEHDPDC